MSIHNRQMKKNSILVFGGVLIFILATLPAIVIPFGLMDDYHYVQPDWAGFFKSFQVQLQLSFGRPLAALVLGIYSGFVRELPDLAYVRLISAVSFGIALGWLAIFLNRAGLKSGIALLVATITVVTGGFVNITMWATAAIFAPGILLAMLACELIYRASSSAPVVSKKVLVSAATLQLLAFCFYPPIANFFGVPIVAMLLFSDRTEWARRYATICGKVYVAAALSYFVLAKLAHVHSDRYQFSVAGDLVGRLAAYFQNVVPISANFITLNTPYMAPIVLGVIAIGYAFFLLREKDRSTFLKTSALVAAAVLIASSHLIIPHDLVTAARAIGSLQAMLALLFCWASIHLLGFLKQETLTRYALSAIAVVSILAGSYISLTAAMNGYLEMKYMAANLRTIDASKISQIVVRKIHLGESFMSSTRHNGFNWTTSDQVSTMIPAMVGDALHTLGHKDIYVENAGFDKQAGSARPVQVTPCLFDETCYIKTHFDQDADGGTMPSVAYVNMNLLKPGGDDKLTRAANPLIELSTSSDVNNGLLKAFSDCCANIPYWEASSFPVQVNISIYTAQGTPVPRLKHYVVEGEKNSAAQMPTEWFLYGKNSPGRDWELLDHHVGTAGALRYASDIAEDKAIKRYEMYKLVFTKGALTHRMRVQKISLGLSE